MAENNEKNEYTWEEISKHSTSTSKWIVIENNVYDVTDWAYQHPGGSTLLKHYAGQDSTEAFRAFHKDLLKIGPHFKRLKIGRVADPLIKSDSIIEDFENIRLLVKKMNLLEPNKFFFLTHFLQIIICEFLAYYVLKTYLHSWGWLAYFLSLFLSTIVQAQAGWLQHDLGHLSIFRKPSTNRICHMLFMGLIKGVSRNWWNHMHYQHHSKPNVIGKDPDVRVQPLFLIGKVIPEEYGRKQIKSLPYKLQHLYFPFIAPPLLFPVYFQIMTFRHVITRRNFDDLALMLVFYAKFFWLYSSVLGFGGALAYYLLMRILESNWFTWVSQCNHIPMQVDYDRAEPWMRLQLKATCNIERSLWNDWFTGHLNFQIEHHLFPTMPRHNYHEIQPYVISVCKKHHIPYVVKSLTGAFRDILKSLKTSGDLWEAAFTAHHMVN